MDAPFVLRIMARRGLLYPGRPDRVARQIGALRRWGMSLYGELRSTAARNPERPAIIDGKRVISYGRLEARARRLANCLRTSYGVRVGDKVGLLCHNSTSMVESMLAISALGAHAVLINTGLGTTQLESVVHSHGVKLLIHDDEFFELLAALSAQVARISADGDPNRPSPTVAGLIRQSPLTALRPPEQPGQLIVLTSGTTGAPKGARRRNPNGLAPLAVIISRIPLRAGERMFIAAPIFHTWGLAALQLCLGLRGTAVIRRRFDPVDTLYAMARHECRSLFAVPVMLQRLLDTQGSVPSLKIAASSGSALPGALSNEFMDRFGDVLYNLYGSTEASWASIATPADLRRSPGCAGRPPHGTRLAIHDRRGQPLPPGEIGRIFVGNDMMFEGYTNGTTKESEDGLIATGDLGHIDQNGLLFIDGREDDMVVSGGENVYPSAVEDLLAGLPQVREVAVAGMPDVEYGQRLAAWIALHPGEWLDSDAVKEYVRHRLARFSVPRDVYFVRALPRNATGKVLVRVLQQQGAF